MCLAMTSANCMDLNAGSRIPRGTCPCLQIRSANERHEIRGSRLWAYWANLGKTSTGQRDLRGADHRDNQRLAAALAPMPPGVAL